MTGLRSGVHARPTSADFDWVKKDTAFREATYTDQRLLERKTVVETALRADVEQIRAPIRIALNEGATPREILT